MSNAVQSPVLADMLSYYRARAGEYDQWFYRHGRYDRGVENNARWFAEVAEVHRALAAANLSGDVLELACGTGIWTEQLLKTARTMAAVDGSPEMIEINRARVGDGRVRYILADLFEWRPDRQYDAVFMGFWLSHVPADRMDRFLRGVAEALRPGGKVFFVDSRREVTSTAADHRLPEHETEVLTRRLNDGREFQIVKVFWEPQELARRFGETWIEMGVRETSTYFLYGVGTRREGKF